jgi:hypothetical protein
MSNSILEMIRSKQEDIENLEKALSKAIAFKENNVSILFITQPREQIVADTLIKRFTDEIQKRSKELLDISYDKEGSKKEEVDILKGDKNYNINSSLNTTNRTPDVWFNFYEKIREAKIFNKKLTNESDITEINNFERIFNTTLEEIMTKPLFSVEENRGKCVDMHEIFLTFQNLKKVNWVLK